MIPVLLFISILRSMLNCLWLDKYQKGGNSSREELSLIVQNCIRAIITTVLMMWDSGEDNLGFSQGGF
jgi:hypothetical protein